MWWALLGILLLISILVQVRFGSRAALGVGFMISLLLPSWIVHTIFGQEIDLRVATTLILLVWRLFDRRQRICWWFSSGDWAIITMFFVNVASDCWNDGISFSHVVRDFGLWSLPYIAGRLSIESVEDWHWLTGIVVIVATICAVSSATEAFTRVNPINVAFGDRPKDRATQLAIRNGLKRAEGPTRHPIWFGMLQCLLLPWTIVAAVRAFRGDGRAWWFITPLFSLVGVFVTLSRGPTLAAAAIFYLMGLLYWSSARKYLMIAGVATVCAGFFLQPQLKLAMEIWANPKYSVKRVGRQVEIGGEKQRLTAMTARWLILIAYRPAIAQAGLLGYGYARTSAFPVDVPLGPDVQQTMAELWSIDIEYLLILFKCGWLGLAAFLGICLTSIWHILRQSRFLDANEQIVPMAIAATLMAVMASFTVEWMSPDYGFPFLWLCGAANGPRMNSALQRKESKSSGPSGCNSQS